ncbi:hypothetical protein JW935_21995 [candidate division KSB1 bacterium]|nr:hypothetical protein [candidate division KSB1 bacterium]
MKYSFRITLTLFIFSTAVIQCHKNATGPNHDNPPGTITQTALAPADGDCLFILGQASTTEMLAYMDRIQKSPPPAGFAFYTSLSDGAVQKDMPRYQSFMENYPNTVLQLAIWTGERQWGAPGYYLDDIVDGKYDKNIADLADACKNFGKPVYIRLGYEFDGWHNAYPPDKYIAAFQYFVDKMRAQNVKNVAYVWHSWGVGAYYGSEDFPDYYPALPQSQNVTQELWYPGDEYVDWVAMSVFGIGWGDLRTNNVVQWLIRFAEDHKKPVMLAETAAIKTTGSRDSKWILKDTAWFQHVFQLCRSEKAVKAFTYINVNWEANNSSSTWGNTRIQDAAGSVVNYWLENIKFYLHGDSKLYPAIGYK